MFFKNARDISNKLYCYVTPRAQFSTSINKLNVATDETITNDISVERILKVSIIGMPNAGKSTFINSLLDRKVCAVSSKVHTTRGKSKAIFTVDNTQVVFLDTPGVVNDREYKKYV